MSDKESDNYYRLITLIVKTGTWTLREVFKKHTTDNIESVIKTHLKQLKRNKSLTVPQLQLLTADKPDLEKFDISLLFLLIRNICTTVETPAIDGWQTAAVPSSDTTVGGYIIGIRNIRNKVVGHSSDAKVSNDHFKKNWAEAEKCLKELAAHVDLLDDIAKEIKTIESMQLTAESNTNLEALLKKWNIEELNTKLDQLNGKADKYATVLQLVLNEVLAMRKQIDGGQHTKHFGPANQQTAPDVNRFMSIMNEEMDQTKEVLESKYDVACKVLGIYTPQQQQPIALPPIVNPNALAEEEIIKYAKELGNDWERFAIFLGYKQPQIEKLSATYPKQIAALLRTMIQKWHDVVARCENENPRKLLAASFSKIDDNMTASTVLGNEKLSNDVKKMKPSPETATKIKDIEFDLHIPAQAVHVIHHLGPSFTRRYLTNKENEQQQLIGIRDAKVPKIEDADGEMD